MVRQPYFLPLRKNLTKVSCSGEGDFSCHFCKIWYTIFALDIVELCVDRSLLTERHVTVKPCQLKPAF